MHYALPLARFVVRGLPAQVCHNCSTRVAAKLAARRVQVGAHGVVALALRRASPRANKLSSRHPKRRGHIRCGDPRITCRWLFRRGHFRSSALVDDIDGRVLAREEAAAHDRHLLCAIDARDGDPVLDVDHNRRSRRRDDCQRLGVHLRPARHLEHLLNTGLGLEDNLVQLRQRLSVKLGQLHERRSSLCCLSSNELPAGRLHRAVCLRLGVLTRLVGSNHQSEQRAAQCQRPEHDQDHHPLEVRDLLFVPQPGCAYIDELTDADFSITILVHFLQCRGQLSVLFIDVTVAINVEVREQVFNAQGRLRADGVRNHCDFNRFHSVQCCWYSSRRAMGRVANHKE
mmetsp:Transcript_12706/g.15345  ORF Transcript_12706/g.15345 Transcript_12706/m.15345 type:complete len:343 (+) Transcript_12706:2656-3684(+)